MLSPIFQVRNFDVKDTFPFRVNIHWEKDDGPACSQLFGTTVKEDGTIVRQHYPSVKSVSFMKTEPFTVTAAYSEDSDVTQVHSHFTNFGRKHRARRNDIAWKPGTLLSRSVQELSCLQGKNGISKYVVTQPHKAPEGATNLSTKVSFELDVHGLVRCNGVVQNHKIEVEEPAPVEVKPVEAKPAEPAAAPADSEMKDAAAGVDGTEAPAEAAAPEAPGGEENGDASNMDAQDTVPEPPKMIKKVKKVCKPPFFQPRAGTLVLARALLVHCHVPVTVPM